MWVSTVTLFASVYNMIIETAEYPVLGVGRGLNKYHMTNEIKNNLKVTSEHGIFNDFYQL